MPAIPHSVTALDSGRPLKHLEDKRSTTLRSGDLLYQVASCVSSSMQIACGLLPKGPQRIVLRSMAVSHPEFLTTSGAIGNPHNGQSMEGKFLSTALKRAILTLSNLHAYRLSSVINNVCPLW
ncbi:hypothetical protein PUN28_008775 [Cardiocondyla obscurior]|uniref:Uncharacterized protein n=1 Tax=Cardiocondyla obscurior TaxID=286306 RepID=A0AAW2FQX2_9HYME